MESLAAVLYSDLLGLSSGEKILFDGVWAAGIGTDYILQHTGLSGGGWSLVAHLSERESDTSPDRQSECTSERLLISEVSSFYNSLEEGVMTGDELPLTILLRPYFVGDLLGPVDEMVWA